MSSAIAFFLYFMLQLSFTVYLVNDDFTFFPKCLIYLFLLLQLLFSFFVIYFQILRHFSIVYHYVLFSIILSRIIACYIKLSNSVQTQYSPNKMYFLFFFSLHCSAMPSMSFVLMLLMLHLIFSSSVGQ